jgi:hypothetical protein
MPRRAIKPGSASKGRPRDSSKAAKPAAGSLLTQRSDRAASTRASTTSRIDSLEKRVALLEEVLEDRIDVEESRRVLDDPRTEWVDWRAAKRRLGVR